MKQSLKIINTLSTLETQILKIINTLSTLETQRLKIINTLSTLETQRLKIINTLSTLETNHQLPVFCCLQIDQKFRELCHGPIDFHGPGQP